MFSEMLAVPWDEGMLRLTGEPYTLESMWSWEIWEGEDYAKNKWNVSVKIVEGTEVFEILIDHNCKDNF